MSSNPIGSITNSTSNIQAQTKRYWLAFSLSLVVYLGLIGIAFWLIQPNSSTQIQLVQVPVNMAMFQPPEPMIEPPKEPEIKKPEPIKPKPPEPPKPKKPEPKKVEPKPLPKPVAKPEPKPEPQPMPEVVPEPKVEPVPVTPQPPVVPQKKQYTAQQVTDEKQKYLNEFATLLAQLAENTYPNRAKRRGWQGRVLMQFTLLKSGKILNTQIIESSGYDSLDEAALSIITERLENQYKAFPNEIEQTSWTIQVPITYNLR